MASNPTQNVASFVLDSLNRYEKISHVFLVPGYVIDPFYKWFSKAAITPIVAAHEGGAVYMADGYGRASQNFGVCMGIGGPGVTNMTTAVSAAYADRSPVLILAGRIPSSWEARGTFQDSSSSSGIDDIALMRPMTDFASSMPNAKAAPIFLRKAMRSIRDVESVPAFLAIPEDVQRQKCMGCVYNSPPKGPYRIVDLKQAEEVPNILCGATYISIFAGNGAVRSSAFQELEQFASTYSIPVFTTMRAEGVLSEEHAMSLGVFGLGGSLWANEAILGAQDVPRTQVLLVLGATLNENNTFLGSAPFPVGPNNLVLVDINPNSNRDIDYDHTLIMADVKEFLVWLQKSKDRFDGALQATKKERDTWVRTIKTHPRYEYEADRRSPEKPIHPARAIAALREAANKAGARNAVVVADSGAHTFFTGHHWESYSPNEFLFLSTTGPMGYGIALGIGAHFARPDRQCICIVGDGSMLMHGMELRTAVRYEVPLIVVVINNGALGNIYLRLRKHRQKAVAEKIAAINPRVDWVAFAKSVGADGRKVENPDDLMRAYDEAFEFIKNNNKGKHNKKPFVVDVICDSRYSTPNTSELPTAFSKSSARSRNVEKRQAVFSWHS